MKCLVTGGLGYIGSHFVIEAINEGLDLVIIDNLSNSSIDVVDRLQKLTGKKITFLNVDLLDTQALDNVFKNEHFESVVHFAGLKAVSESTKQPLHYYENNVVGSICLLNAMKKHRVNNIVFSSSATVYGVENPVPYVETQSKNPINPYGRTKAIIEDALEDFCQSNQNFSAISLRYFNPIGAHPSGIIGDSPLGVPNNLLPYITRVATKQYEFLNVYGADYKTPDGTGVRDYIHVMDLVNGHIKALNYQKNKKGYDIFNLGSSSGVSVLQMVKTFEKINQIKIPYRLQARRAGDIDKFWACAEKAKKILKWQTTYHVKDMVRDAWCFEKNHYSEMATSIK